MRVGCESDFGGANVPAPAEDVDNENPSLVALGKKYPLALRANPATVPGVKLVKLAKLV